MHALCRCVCKTVNMLLINTYCSCVIYHLRVQPNLSCLYLSLFAPLGSWYCVHVGLIMHTEDCAVNALNVCVQ